MLAHGYLKPVVVGEHAGAAAVRVPRGHGGHAGGVRSAAFAPAPPAQSTDVLAARASQDTSRAAGDGRRSTPDRRATAPAADVHGRLPGGARGQAAPDQLPSGGHAYPAGTGRRRPQDRLLEPRARGTRPGRSPAADAPADRQAPAAGLPGRPPGRAPAGRGHLRPAGAAAGRRANRDPRAGARLASVARVRGGPPRARARCSCCGTTADPFDGEDEPPVTLTWPWPAATATVTDAFGRPADRRAP